MALARDRCVTYLLESHSVDAALDLIEFSFFYIDKVTRDFSSHDRQSRGMKVPAGDAINELNERFRRAGVGYQFENLAALADLSGVWIDRVHARKLPSAR